MMKLPLRPGPDRIFAMKLLAALGLDLSAQAEARMRLAAFLMACGLVIYGSCLTPSLAASVGTESIRGDQLVIRSWGTEAGLPQNTVNVITQTREGYLWLATRDGLARFDGVHFTIFALAEGLPNVDILALYEDRMGTLWIGTAGGGVSRLVKGRIERVTAPDRETSGNNVVAFAEDRKGSLWVGTSTGLRIWRSGHLVQNEATAALGRAPIRTLLSNRGGGMWIATARQGLFEFKNDALLPQPGPPGDEQVNAYCLLEDRQGQLWAGVGNWKVLCRRAGGWQVYNQNDGLPFAYVSSLAEGTDGTIWAGSLDEGLYFLQAGRFNTVKKENGLSANDIRSLRADREGNLWVGTRTGGLNRLSQRKLIHCGVAQGLTNDYTRSVAESADGTLWVATTGGGLYRGGLNGFERFTPSEEARFYAHADSVLVTGDASVWWGGAYALLCWREGRLTGCYTNQPWVLGTSITALCPSHQGGLWIGNSVGALVRFKDGEFISFPQQVARGAITALAEETNGCLWVGSPGGELKRLQPGGGAVLWVTNGLLSYSIRTLHLDDQGTLWIGTAGGGLSRWRDGRIATFTTQQGLGANTVSQIVEDDYGCLWLGSNRGIFRVRKSELEALAAGKLFYLHPRTYGLNAGMPAEECSSGFCPAGLKTRSGLVCFSTVKGLVFLDPSKQENGAPPPEVLLEEVLVNGKVQELVPAAARPGLVADGGVPLQKLVVAPGGRDVELHYTGLSFASPEKVGFRYRLEGLDTDWVEVGGRRTAYYHRLPPGNFVFRVVACNADGLWNEQGPALAITMRPYLWQTRWFVGGMTVVLVGVVAGALRYAERRRYKRRLALLETQHAIERERLRISQDMHDDIGSILTQVSQLSDLGQSEAGGQLASRGHFERIGAQARAAVQALDEIVWATNPKNDNLPRFAEYVCHFADEFFEDTAVRCWQEVPTDLPNLPLRADQRHNVFLAVKEAFSNVLKHSRATEVWLRLALVDSRVGLEIEDNGRGFNPQQTSRGRNGLDNMKARLAECGGEAEILSQPGKGTKLRFGFPLPAAGG